MGQITAGMDVAAFDNGLLELYKVIPRRMGNVKDHLLKGVPGPDELKALENNLANELQQELDLSDGEADERQRYALLLVQDQRVIPQSSATRDDGLREYQFEVKGKSGCKTVIRLDADGRVRFAECSCSFHRRNKLRQGPCPHLMASVLQCAV